MRSLTTASSLERHSNNNKPLKSTSHALRSNLPFIFTFLPSAMISAIALCPNPLSSRSGCDSHRCACSSRPVTVCAGCCPPLFSIFTTAFDTSLFKSCNFSSIPRANPSAWTKTQSDGQREPTITATLFHTRQPLTCGDVPLPSSRNSHSASTIVVISETIFLIASLSCGKHRSATSNAWSKICRNDFSPMPPRTANGS